MIVSRFLPMQIMHHNTDFYPSLKLGIAFKLK